MRSRSETIYAKTQEDYLQVNKRNFISAIVRKGKLLCYEKD